MASGECLEKALQEVCGKISGLDLDASTDDLVTVGEIYHLSSDHAGNPNYSFFPFDSLPDEIQSRILALLPIATLVLCKAVSWSWRSLISSPAFADSYPPSRDPIFLLYCDLCPTLAACAYLPSTDRWIDFRFPQPVPVVATTGTSLILGEFGRDRLYIVNPFLPPHPIHFLPQVLRAHIWYKVLALIDHSPSDYIIVVVSPTDGILHTQTYHSRSGCWEERGHLRLGWGFINFGNAVYLDGLLFCLSRGPNCLLTFDPVRGQWSMLDLDLPIPPFTYHLLGFGGELYLTAALWEDTVVTRIGIWKLDWTTMAWTEFDLMPDKYLAEFSVQGFSCLTITACMGMICFSTRDPKEIVMCDLAVRRWWCPQPCNIPGKRGLTIGSAIEPHINLLK